MLTEERRDRLKGMKAIKRFFVIGWWLLRSLIRKLTPARRLLLVAALMFIVVGRIDFSNSDDTNMQIETPIVGVFLILFILGLELKDKLLAHEELHDGRAVQQALMPAQSPKVPGWDLWLFTRSANEVGGDLIDFIRIDDSRYGVAIGDVAGKGLSAALFSAKLQATLKAIVPDFTSLELLGAKLNHIYSRDGLRSLFASLAYFEFGPQSGVIHILNAGHLPPVVVRGASIEPLQKGGPALGIVQNGAFAEQRVELRKDNLLIAYSDGLTDAQNVAGEFFGEERFLSLLPRINKTSAGQFGSRLVTETDLFIGDGKATDDLSIIILKRTV
jgi:sigma-B regulation protein RsbU (phosphoserine phosphatase)